MRSRLSQMLVSCNGQERTLVLFDNLLTQGGWKIERVEQTPVPWKNITAKPI